MPRFKNTKHKRTNKTLGIRTQSKNNRWFNTQSQTPVCSTQHFSICAAEDRGLTTLIGDFLLTGILLVFGKEKHVWKISEWGRGRQGR